MAPLTAVQRRLATLVAALVLLNASLTFENLWPTPWLRWGSSLSVEFAVCVLFVGAVAWRVGQIPPAALRGLAAIWLLLVLGRYAQVTAPALYGREVNLYWDIRYVPDLIAMSVRAAPAWLVLLAVAAAGIAVALAYASVLWALGHVAVAATRRRPRAVLMCIAGGAVVAFGAQRWNARLPQLVAAPVTQTYARQLGLVTEAFGRKEKVADSPVMATTFDAVQGADVFLVFVESYGATTFDRPDFVERLAASRSSLTADIRDTGRQVVSTFVESPTFGGSSWLAHLSLMSGVHVGDEDTNRRLLSERRDTIVHVFRHHGYHTVAMMPGLIHAWPEGSFYTFDEIFDAKRLDYRGPPFGWFLVPDQIALDRIDAMTAAPAARRPLFVFFPTTSTHFPFGPTPPYQPDWRRLSESAPYDETDLTTAYLEETNWDDFGPAYTNAVSYDYASLGGFLRRQAGRDVVMILIGDHQPAAAVSGEAADWDVPVHVVTSRAAVLERLVTRGFRPGLTPERPRLASMAGLLPILLDAFGS